MGRIRWRWRHHSGGYVTVKTEIDLTDGEGSCRSDALAVGPWSTSWRPRARCPVGMVVCQIRLCLQEMRHGHGKAYKNIKLWTLKQFRFMKRCATEPTFLIGMRCTRRARCSFRLQSPGSPTGSHRKLQDGGSFRHGISKLSRSRRHGTNH